MNPLLWLAAVIDTTRPAIFSEPPLFMGCGVLDPFALDPDTQLVHRDYRRAAGPRARDEIVDVIAVPVRRENQVDLRGLLQASGHAGLFASQGSNKSRFPPGVLMRNVECPSQVISSFPMALMLTAFSDAVNAFSQSWPRRRGDAEFLNAEIAGIAEAYAVTRCRTASVAVRPRACDSRPCA